MSISLLVYYVLAKMMSVIESASLGNGISDPLVSSVELPDGDKLSNKITLTMFRRNIPPEEIINTGKYEGYIYNQNRCIQFNNRILCGYDRNKGFQLDDYTMIDIGSGCRARGDRLECGYDNPPRINTNLRYPDFKNVKHGENEEHGKHDVPHGEHDVPHYNHHHHHHHRHGDKHHNGLTRQAPTRTALTTDPTVQSTIIDGSESDYLENELLKSAFDEHKLLMKGEDTIIKSVKLPTASIKPINLATDAVQPVTITTIKPIKHKAMATASIKPINLATDAVQPVTITTIKPIKHKAMATASIKPINLATNTVKPVTTTTIKPIKRKSTLIHKRKISKSSKTTKTTSTAEITKTLAASSEPNNASDGQMTKRIIRLAPIKKQKRRRLIETFSDLPKLISTDNSKSDTTTVLPISKISMKRNEEKLTTACVEQGDRIVCYDFNKP